jgi:uncharacterized protein YbaP (TraB family)
MAGMKLLKWLIGVNLFIFALFAWAMQPTVSMVPMSAEVALGKGLCWKIEKEKQVASYLYGTMHIGDKRVVTLAPKVQKIFNQSDSVSLEILPDYAAMAALMRGMMFTDGRSLEDVIGKHLYSDLVHAISRHGIDEGRVKYLRPWAIMGIMSSPVLQEGEALDMHLYTNAQKQGKPVYGLETAEEQIQKLNGISKEAQVDIIRSLIHDEIKVDEVFRDFLKLYLDRDLKSLMDYANQFSDQYPAFAASFNSSLIDDRNVLMVNRMQSRLKEGNAFIAVGALHLPGEKGILHLLEQQGYRVTPVY